MPRSLFWITLPLAILAAVLVLLRLDLRPEVSSDFFFSSDDPEIEASKRIEELFPSRPQLLLTASGAIESGDYLGRLAMLTGDLEAVDGIASVRSLVRGPLAPTLVPESPIWSRLLLSRPPRPSGDRGPAVPFSQLILTLDGESEAVVEAVEALVEEHSTPAFSLRLSGVPYVVELIRRHLERDLRWFSGFAFLAFGVLLAVLTRSWRIAVGALTTCAGAAFMTLAALHLVGFRVGILTANLLTIVFVLTLSHIVFLTASWRHRALAGAAHAADEAVGITFQASFWCMMTTVFGFASLLFASAKPLRELGLSGAVGSSMAILAAYGLYPAFLRRLRVGGAAPQTVPGVERAARPRPVLVAVLALLALIGALGLAEVDTDPSLLSYFEPGGEIRSGLEFIDRNGGSSPLYLVVRDAGEASLIDDDVVDRLRQVQSALESDPAVGTALSLPVLLDEARRHPLAIFLSRAKLLDLLDGEAFDSVARQFITADRQRGLIFLRLREADRERPRHEIVARLTAAVTDQNLDVELVGGLYDLQGKLGDLVASSLITGLAGLSALFLLIAGLLTRSPRTTVAMVATLLAVPVILLGLLGHLRQPLDVIASPAANVAIALGIDSMIHLVMAVRRRRAAGEDESRAWALARAQMRRPISEAALILAAGFGVFVLSSFPPTQRFGVLVAAGTVLAALLALEVLPLMANGVPGSGRERR